MFGKKLWEVPRKLTELAGSRFLNQSSLHWSQSLRSYSAFWFLICRPYIQVLPPNIPLTLILYVNNYIKPCSFLLSYSKLATDSFLEYRNSLSERLFKLSHHLIQFLGYISFYSLWEQWHRTLVSCPNFASMISIINLTITITTSQISAAFQMPDIEFFTFIMALNLHKNSSR